LPHIVVQIDWVQFFPAEVSRKNDFQKFIDDFDDRVLGGNRFIINVIEATFVAAVFYDFFCGFWKPIPVCGKGFEVYLA
jgi:hypothetical protein